MAKKSKEIPYSEAFGELEQILSRLRSGQLGINELTASVNFRPLNWLSATVSHTFLNHNKLGILGFALNLHPAGFNLFLGADYIGMNWVRYESIPVPYDMKSVNVYAGIGFNFGRPKHLKADKPKKQKREE